MGAKNNRKTRPPVSKTRILLVDDQPELLYILKFILERSGFHVESAANGREALDLVVAGRHFDLVITDIRMPKMDGHELLRWIRKWKEDLPVIMITGHSTQKDRLQAVREGAFAYITKPLGTKALLRVVRKALKGGN